MLRRFSDLLCSKCCFYSLILAFIISLGYINIANAYVCFLPDHSDCADGDYKDFWPCSGSDCIDAKDGECDASYNSNKSNNDCGDVCTKCADSSSPYNGLYKCPENTCNCNEYTSTSAYNECGESCKVCRIAGDKNYGKYKCPAVPEEGCANPCKDCTLTEAQAQAKMAADPCMECEQCANLNCTDAQQSKWRCSENKLCKQCRAEGYNKDKNSSEYITSQQTCSRMQCAECPYNDISDGVAWYKCGECGSEYTQNYNNITLQEKVNHCDENQTCGCYMVCDNCFGKEFTMQDCKNAGYDSAKNECSGIRGTVYEKCCRTCDGYMYPTDLSKTSEGWSCTECPDFCGGGSKYSCGCKEGYHDDGNGGCAKDCAVVTCTAKTVPQNATCTQTCQAKNADCTNNGDEVCTAWVCNSGYHDDDNGGCVEDNANECRCHVDDNVTYLSGIYQLHALVDSGSADNNALTLYSNGAYVGKCSASAKNDENECYARVYAAPNSPYTCECEQCGGYPYVYVDTLAWHPDRDPKKTDVGYLKCETSDHTLKYACADGYEKHYIGGGYECGESSSGSSSGSVTVKVGCTNPYVNTNQNVGVESFNCTVLEAPDIFEKVVFSWIENGVEKTDIIEKVGESTNVYKNGTMCKFYFKGLGTYSAQLQCNNHVASGYQCGCSYPSY